MRFFHLITVAVLSLGLFAMQSQAQQPDIIGNWSAETEILLELDDKIVKVSRLMTVKIDDIDGSLFMGSRTWRAISDDPGNVAGVDVLEATEPFIGAIDSDGVTLRFVETDDHGMMFGELLETGELELTYMETWPHAVVYTVVMQRQSE